MQISYISSKVRSQFELQVSQPHQEQVFDFFYYNILQPHLTDWWFGICFSIFPIYWECMGMSSSQLTNSYFSEGFLSTTNQTTTSNMFPIFFQHFDPPKHAPEDPGAQLRPRSAELRRHEMRSWQRLRQGMERTRQAPFEACACAGKGALVPCQGGEFGTEGFLQMFAP